MEIIMAIFLAGALAVICSLYLRLKNSEKTIQEKDAELTKYVMENVDMQKQIAEAECDYKYQKEMADEIIKIQNQSRALKHDMKNHTLVIMSYLEKGQIKEARQYTSDILDRLNAMYTYVSVGNSLLNYIINHKLSRAKEMKIDIKAEIENLSFSYMDSIDFSSLLNNMLDNATEAAVQTKRKMLFVTITHQKGFDIIHVGNSIDHSVLEQNPGLETSKNEPAHGVGMKQIKKIIEKYDGVLDIYEEQDLFHVVAGLQNTKNEHITDGLSQHSSRLSHKD